MSMTQGPVSKTKAPDPSWKAGLAELRALTRPLPKEDRKAMGRLASAYLRMEDDPEGLQAVLDAIEEILEQEPVTGRLMLLDGADAGDTASPELRRWMEFVGTKIREARKAAGMTQDELADAADLPRGHIGRLENGRHSPSRLTLEKIAKGLGRPLSDFDPSA